MSNLIKLDDNGVSGPLGALINHHQTCTDHELLSLINILITNFKNITYKEPDSTLLSVFNLTIEFAKNNNRDAAINTLFNYFLQLPVDDNLNSRVKKYIAMPSLRTFEVENNEQNLELFSKVMLSYVSPDNLEKTCSNKESGVLTDELREIRMSIGRNILAECTTKEINRTTFDKIINILRYIQSIAQQDKQVWNYVSRYASLFAASSEPYKLSDEVSGLLDTSFRKRFDHLKQPEDF